MRSRRAWLVFAGCLLLVGAGTVAWVCQLTGGPLAIEFELVFDDDLIHASAFGEPPQVAIWLESPDGKTVRTVFVTRRAGMGDWEGKLQCPAALPLWHHVFQRETGLAGLPSPLEPADPAITGATPQLARWRIRTTAARHRHWHCRVEVNLAGDFNASYQAFDPVSQARDLDMDGQPALLYGADIVVGYPGQRFTPTLLGQTRPRRDPEQIVEPIDERLTTAPQLVRQLTVRVCRPAR